MAGMDREKVEQGLEAYLAEKGLSFTPEQKAFAISLALETDEKMQSLLAESEPRDESRCCAVEGCEHEGAPDPSCCADTGYPHGCGPQKDDA